MLWKGSANIKSTGKSCINCQEIQLYISLVNISPCVLLLRLMKVNVQLSLALFCEDDVERHCSVIDPFLVICISIPDTKNNEWNLYKHL